jgi:hypothetical protein
LAMNKQRDATEAARYHSSISIKKLRPPVRRSQIGIFIFMLGEKS